MHLRKKYIMKKNKLYKIRKNAIKHFDELMSLRLFSWKKAGEGYRSINEFAANVRKDFKAVLSTVLKEV